MVDGKYAPNMGKAELRYLIRRTLYGYKTRPGGSNDKREVFNEHELLEIFAYIYPYALLGIRPSDLVGQLGQKVVPRSRRKPKSNLEGIDYRSRDTEGGIRGLETSEEYDPVAELLADWDLEPQSPSELDAESGDGVVGPGGEDSGEPE